MFRFFWAFLGLVGILFADDRIPNIDFTCDTCGRRYLDSLNVYDRPVIRVNQVGFRPADNHKFAFVADPGATTFKVVDASSGASAWEGSLTPLGSWPKPNIWVNGAFNSISSVYEFGNADSSRATENLYSADFSKLTRPGTYFMVVGPDTSFPFIIDEYLFNAVFETTLRFFGIQRCGNTNSQLHGACHVKDGQSIGHDLSGGWHDCGDHFKVSETLGYAAFVLSLAYNVYSERAEDHYGASYNDTVTTDGIPDILAEAKVGVDYIYKLYMASKADGLIDKGDMYHSIGVGSADHQFWDVPEHQDAQSPAKGGAPRPVAKGIGTLSGTYAAAMAFFAVGWEMYQTDRYSDSLIAAAKEIYAKVTKPTFPKYTDELLGFYPGGSNITNVTDDAAAAALALWYATRDSSYAFDLYKNTAINDNASNYKYNLPYFRGGFLGLSSGFYPGGWMTDYENIHAYVLFAFAKLILPTAAKAQSYGIAGDERDSLLTRVIATMTRLTDDGTQGDSVVSTNPYGSFTVTPPYNLVWTSSDWGFNRYNMGAANAVFMLYDMTGDERYLNVALDNFYYNMGANPWGLSFIMGAGSRTENHPHNRAANPDGYNAGGMPYEYKCPKGALMGGAAPHQTLKDDWNDYTATETCIDFSAQFIIPGLSLSKNVPEDVEGPLFSNIRGTAISDTSAVISWDSDERAVVTVYYAKTPDGAKVDSVTAPGGVGGSVAIGGLTPGETYYFYLVGHDVKKNFTTDDNHGKWYSWTQTLGEANIGGVTICQVTNNGARIYWWTAERATNGLVKFGESAQDLSQRSVADSGKAVRFHEALLSGLNAGTTYYFDVLSGASTDDNSGKHYSFTTSSEAAYADFSVYVKPSSYQSPCGEWENCNTLFVSVTNNDTVAYENAELRIYLKTSNLGPVSYINSVWDGTGTSAGTGNILFGTPQSDGLGGYYLPITLGGTFAVSGQYLFQIKFTAATFKDLAGSWSLRAHNDSTDPVPFNGIDLSKGPHFSGSETTYIEDVDGKKEIAYTKNPYVAIFYHGTHIYGYPPDYDASSSSLSIARTLSLEFFSPFKSPAASLEDTARTATYSGESKVSPSGFLDDFEGNGVSYFGTNTEYVKKYDDYVFSVSRDLAYGNNFVEWVTWHNHGANAKGSYDCACMVVRSNVEWDSITTPLEKRYLKFHLDTVRAYVGKRAQVTVSLYDSTGTLLEDENITVKLSVGEGAVFFYTSATADIATTTLTLVNGSATFFVSGETPLETTLYATAATSGSKYNYTSAKARLFIEELPPWPIISNAEMLDTDCDNVPDKLKIVLSAPYLENQKFVSVRFEYRGDTIEVSDALIADSLLTVSFQAHDTSAFTNPEGPVTLTSDISGEIKTSADFYRDAVPPTILSLSILERLDTTTSDRIYIQFSEPISAPGLSLPIALFDKDGNRMDKTPSVTASKLYNEALNVWEFTIPFESDQSSAIVEGMRGQLLESATIADKAGNGVSAVCSAPILPFTLKILPVPLQYASISDADGDGLAERVDAVFSSSVDERHAPDSIAVIFGSAHPETLFAKTYDWNAERTEAALVMPSPFKLGNTSGNHSGLSSKGGDLVGAGLLIQHKGAGANYESDSTLAEDLTGPVILGGTVGAAGSFVSLIVEASEPLVESDTGNAPIQRERKGPVNVFPNRYTLSGKTIHMLYAQESETAVKEGDRIRFTPLDETLFTDLSGNRPARENPWANVSGSGNPQIVIHFRPEHPVSDISLSKIETGGEARADFRLLVLDQKSRKWDIYENGDFTTSADTADYAPGGMAFRLDMDVPRGAGIGEAPAWKAVALDIDLPIYTNLGGFVNRFHEKFTLAPKYLSTDNQIVARIEWLSRRTKGPVSASGKAAGTGAYIVNAQIDTRFVPDPESDSETIRRFSSKDSYRKTQTFGIRRTR